MFSLEKQDTAKSLLLLLDLPRLPSTTDLVSYLSFSLSKERNFISLQFKFKNISSSHKIAHFRRTLKQLLFA